MPVPRADPSVRASDPLRAIAWLMAAVASFVAMALSVRELTTGMHAFEMLFLRSAIGVAILAVVFSRRGWHELRTVQLTGHLLRNVVHFAGQTFWIFGIALLPLATVSAIEFTTPMWGALLAVLFLGERMTRGRWVALVMGFIGTLVILRPGVEVVSAGALIMLACTFFFGATNVITKWLTRADSALAILFYMVLIQTGLGALASLFVWTPVTLGDWPFLLLLALTGLSAHYSLTRALSLADATFIMPFEFIRLPVIALIAFMLYAEPIEVTTLLGAALIFSGTLYSLRREATRKAGGQAGATR